MEQFAELIGWLAENGYESAEIREGAGFGDCLVRYVRGDMAVRLVKDRGQSFIDLSCRAWGGGWYDVTLVRAVLDHEPADGSVDLGVQVEWVQSNLLGRLSETGEAVELSRQLETLVDARARARFGF
jgi:hypothetical protein